MDTKGVTVSRTLDKLGNRASDTAQIFFEDVRIPKKNIIGEEGMGFTYQMMQFQRERLWGAASSEHEWCITLYVHALCKLQWNLLSMQVPDFIRTYVHTSG